METNINTAQHILQEGSYETSDSATSHAKAALSEARDAVTNGASGLASAAAQATTGLSNGSATPATTTLATTSRKAERTQVIGEDQKFSSSLSGDLSRWDMLEKGFGYDVVAVFGSQSTGKSTLLNKLFGTSFDVMDETQRRQTTKGIWMCRGQDMNVLVMDVEGTDGRERGEDQDFERKSALFSMASAEVLIVNLWEHQVGLYQGANMGLLKTVFEVNLGLFQASKARQSGPKDKTLLLFVIRDHVGATPLSNLQNTLMADLNRIWDGLSKPEGLENSQISDYFDMMFATLPHKILMPGEFDKQVIQLRQRFINPKDPNFVFKTEYHKRIPADGLPHYLESIWEQVMANKDLDLPTQQELLAQFRCDEIANASFAVFSNEVKAFRRPIEAGTVLETLGADMGRHRATALAKFDKDASRYHQEVYKRKRTDLLEKLNSTLSPFFLGQLKNLHKAVLAQFRAAVLDRLKGEGYDFKDVVEGERANAENKFKAASLLVMLQDTDWSYEEEFMQLQDDITQIADQCRVEETKKMVLQIERNIKKQIAEPTELALARPAPDMWDKILKAFTDALEKAEALYLRKAKSFNCTEEENHLALSTLRRKSWLALRAKVDEQTADTVLAAKLRTTFEDRFRYDSEGVPRVWKPDDDIDGLFRKARDETLALIPLYARIEPADPNLSITLPSTSDDAAQSDAVAKGEEEEFDFPSTLIIFTETRQSEVANRFRKEADAYYVEAKRSTVSSIAQVPYWMYGVMVVLGWNEAMAVLSSPIYFAFLLICIASAYVVWKLNLSGPILQVSRAVGREVHRLAEDQLRQHFNQPLPQPAILRDDAAPTSSAATHSAPPRVNVSAPPEEIELSEKMRE